jgi:hypothetical protein
MMPIKKQAADKEVKKYVKGFLIVLSTNSRILIEVTLPLLTLHAVAYY